MRGVAAVHWTDGRVDRWEVGAQEGRRWGGGGRELCGELEARGATCDVQLFRACFARTLMRGRVGYGLGAVRRRGRTAGRGSVCRAWRNWLADAATEMRGCVGSQRRRGAE
eukprot:7381319-Prymnesium_polylepis.2